MAFHFNNIHIIFLKIYLEWRSVSEKGRKRHILLLAHKHSARHKTTKFIEMWNTFSPIFQKLLNQSFSLKEGSFLNIILLVNLFSLVIKDAPWNCSFPGKLFLKKRKFWLFDLSQCLFRVRTLLQRRVVLFFRETNERPLISVIYFYFSW